MFSFFSIRALGVDIMLGNSNYWMFLFANELSAFKLRFVSDLQRNSQVLTYVEASI